MIPPFLTWSFKSASAAANRDQESRKRNLELAEAANATRTVKCTPFNATSSVTFTSSDSTVVSVTKVDNRTVKITGVDASVTPVTITATANGHTDTITVTCVAGS